MILWVVKLLESKDFHKAPTDGVIVGIFDSEDKARDAIDDMARQSVEDRMYDTYTYEPIQLNKNLLRDGQVV